MLKSMNARETNYESSLDAKDLSQLRGARRDHSKFARDRTVLAVVCFAWKEQGGIWYDLSQGEICGENGTGIGRFVYIQSFNGLNTHRPSIYGSVVWECELTGYGTPLVPAVPTTGFGPLNYSQPAPIFQLIRPRYEITLGTVCAAMLCHSTNILYPIATMPGSATPIQATLNSTSYHHQLPSVGAYPGFAYSIVKRYYTPLVALSQSPHVMVPNLLPDVSDTNMRGIARSSNLLIEHGEYYRIIVTGCNDNSGAGDHGGAVTIFDGVFNNATGITGSVTPPDGFASAAVGYTVNASASVSGILATLTESSVMNVSGKKEAYMSGAYTMALGTLSFAATCDSFGRITAIAVTSTGTSNLSVMVVGGL